MTNHRHRNPINGPRRIQRYAELHRREAMLRSGRTLNLTVELARAADEVAAHRRARLAKGGDGDTAPMSAGRRAQVYGARTGKITLRQYRQLYRIAQRVNAPAYPHGSYHVDLSPLAFTTKPKGYATPRRPMISAKGVQA